MFMLQKKLHSWPQRKNAFFGGKEKNYLFVLKCKNITKISYIFVRVSAKNSSYFLKY